MRRRELSTVIFGSVAGAMLLPKTSVAQSCTPPCYARTQDEINAGVVPTDTQYLPFDVRRYGATMDGSVQTSALSQAIAVASAAGGGEIFIPQGVLRITSAQVLPLRTSLRGLGREISKIVIDGAFTGISVTALTHDWVASQAHTRIEGIGFSGASNAAGALHFARVDWVVVRDCAFRNFTASTAVGITMTQCFRWTVEHCFFENITSVGLNLASESGVGCNHGVFGPNNEVVGNNQASFIGLNLDRGQNITITGNDFEGSGNGNKAIDMAGSDGIWICGNYIEQWTQAAIAANSGAANHRTYVMENVIHASSTVVCNFNNVSAPNNNIVFALNRFADIAATQTCVFSGTTTNLCEFNNDPDLGKITEAYAPSCITARALQKSVAWDPGAVASGAVTAINVTVAGAVLGDPCISSFDQLSGNNWMISAHVSATNTVRVVLLNKEAVAIDCPAGTLRIKVFK